MELKDRRIVVTGGAGDIGLAIASAAHAQGARVAILDNREDALDTVRQHIDIACIHCDVTDARSVTSAFEQVRAQVGPPNALINNAGVATAETLDRTSLDQWEQDIQLNLTAAFTCFKAALADLIGETDSRYIAISSVNGLGSFGHPAYSAAKAALNSFTRSIAVEYGGQGLRANTICPGTVRTRAWDERQKNNPEVMENVSRFYPLRDVSTPEDIAAVAMFLLGSGARMITGASIPVDGGLTAGTPEMPEAFTQVPFVRR
ncbi:SDR family oxidoreductase [Rhodobacteraceae bacterium RKSG542]|uniref:SDR family oxidoreductase n=1 Tax=Pseudovibrio flavus TaxID=2529854 RepID=UPI0012BB4D8B|nr:SDR family oxidoreductase [Pseudovibrio flavus]MTI16454.1 SDR family oxidoreductase [Pseudovibrio flavus]